MGPPEEERIKEELNRVLLCHEFRSSKRSQDFLRYVVDNTLHGHADMLKERTIGIEVFGRSTGYDPSDDATVRVKAGEVRKRLGIYYSGEGAKNTVRIELPLGTYVPEFRTVGDPAAALAPTLEPTASALTRRTGPQTAIVAGAVAGALCFVAIGVWLLTRTAATPLDEFWAPVLSNSSPVLVGAAFVPVFGLNRDPKLTGPARPEDFTPLNDQFVGGGDLIAVSRLTAMLTRMRRPYRLKVDASFPDLRTGSAVLVGYSYTRWREISSQMRYFIDTSGTPVITDNGKPTDWALPHLPADRRTNEDYAIVSRVFHPDTHAMLVEIAGITQYGTDAASDMVTNPELMAEALHGAPQDWQKKNLQLVLHVKVIAGAPSSPQVLKRHFW
jgi:hypothetical protein